MAGDKNKVDFLSKASLPLQILLFFNGCYTAIFFIATLVVFIWKGVELPYAPQRYAPEIVLLFAWLFVDGSRLFLGSKGNKTENPVILVVFIILSVFAALGNIYFVVWQTYVLRLDLYLNIVALVFVGLEVIMSIVSIVRFGGS